MNHLGTKILETKRLILRKTIESDAEPMFKNWASDSRVTKFMTWYPYETAQQLHDTYHQYLLKETNEPIGSIGVVNSRDDIESVEIGYCLGYNWWHLGIMTEAFTEVIRLFLKKSA